MNQNDTTDRNLDPVSYHLNVHAFHDATRNGCGDFRRLIQNLDRTPSRRVSVIAEVEA